MPRKRSSYARLSILTFLYAVEVIELQNKKQQSPQFTLKTLIPMFKGKFKHMIGKMGIKAKQLKHAKLMKDLTTLYNYMVSRGIDSTTLDAETLWELKDISDVNTR